MNRLSKEQIPLKLKVPPIGKLLLAFSGGSDSLCLMYLLSFLVPDRFEALYINHHIRNELELENELVQNKKNAELLGVKLSVIDLEPGSVSEYAKRKNCGIEASCRALRYKVLQDYAEANGFDYILTAHHREDQVETVLMRMLSDSPFYTYQGILYQDGRLVRPLLYVSKAEINSIISYSGLSFSEDSTNKDVKYRRNDIRHNLLPYITETQRGLISKIAANVFEYRKRVKEIPLESYKHYILIKRDLLLAATKEEFERAIFKASLKLDNPNRLSRNFLSEIFFLVEKGSGKASTAHLDFIATNDYLKIFKRYDDFSIEYRDDIKEFSSFIISHEKTSSKDLFIDTSLFSGSVMIRKSKLDDRIALKEGTKKVRELEKRAHVPFSIVLKDEEGIIAVFLGFLGAKDRLSTRFLSHYGKPFIIL